MLAQLKKLGILFDRRDRLHFAGLLGLMVIGSLLDVVGVGAVPAFVAALAVPERVMAYPLVASVLTTVGISTARELVIWGGIGLIVVYVLKNVFLSIIFYIQVRTMEHYRVRLARHMFKVYMTAPLEFHLARNSAELLRNINLETREIVQGVMSQLLNMVMSLLMTVFVIILLLVTTPSIAMVGIAIVGGGSWLFMRSIKERLHRFGKEARFQRREGIQTINQGLGSLLEARVYGREDFFVDRFHHSIARLGLADRLRFFIEKVSTPVMETIAVTGLLIIVLVLVIAGSDLTLLIPTLALFGAAIVRLRATVSRVVASMSMVRYSISAIDSLFDDLVLLQGQVNTKKVVGALRPPRQAEVLRMREGLVLDGVTYAYPETEVPALQDIHLTVRKGTSIAFVGSTGSGKTTLVNVLLGLLKPQHGTITVDGTDIHANLRGWHANIGYIPQTIFLLDDSIRHNIAFGLLDDQIDDEKVARAIRAAQLQDFIDELDAGAETVVGERGVRLSGGQRQRIGLARALYHNPEVLIMDEATSSLDNHTESLVMQALEALKVGRTFIMIAHRLSTVRHCDRLYFMKDGRIDAEGTYEELSIMHQDFRQMAEIV